MQKEEGKNKYNEETIKTALDILQSEFLQEKERNNNFQSKTETMLTVTAIVFTATTFFLQIILEHKWLIWLNIPLLIICGMLTLISILIFINVLRTRLFKRINYTPLVTVDELQKDNVEVQSRLIATYRETLEENRKIVDKKARSFNYGVYILYFILLLLFISLSSTLFNLKRIDKMPEDKNIQSQQNMSNQQSKEKQNTLEQKLFSSDTVIIQKQAVPDSAQK
ncbi:MAG: hypothetical protein ACMUIU_17440 [bacterium]